MENFREIHFEPLRIHCCENKIKKKSLEQLNFSIVFKKQFQ